MNDTSIDFPSVLNGDRIAYRLSPSWEWNSRGDALKCALENSKPKETEAAPAAA